MNKKLTYSEQLRHPNWQRKRLEVMEHAVFRCQSCDAEDKTLHVHHRRYIKGRMAWEYENSNFDVLCECCHHEAHRAKEAIDEILARLPSMILPRIVGVLAGYATEANGDPLPKDIDFAFQEDIALGAFSFSGADYDAEDIDTLRTLSPDDVRRLAEVLRSQ